MSTSTVPASPGSVHRPARSSVESHHRTHRFTETTRELNDAYLDIVRALPVRPAPTIYWKERARAEERRIAHPMAAHILVLQSAMRAAIETGDPDIEAATRLAVDAYFERCADAVLSVGDVLTSDVSHASLISKHSNAIASIASAAESASDAEFHAAETQVRRVVADCEVWLRRRSFAPRWRMV